MRILFTGGGSGGHFFPIIAVAREFRRLAEDNKILDIEFFYIGPNDFGREILLREDIHYVTIPTGKMRRYVSIQNVSDVVKTAVALLTALWQMFVIMPDAIFSKGGYGSFPALFAAWLYRIPVMIHDSDALPGVVTRWSAKFARKIGVAFPSAAKFFSVEKTAVVGNPIRKQLVGGVRERARENFSVFSEKPVVLVLGSSQGAAPINQMILSGLAEFLKDFEIIHQTGLAMFKDITDQAGVILTKEEKQRYHPFGFLSEAEMRDALAAADAVITRASASAIFEIAAVGKASILIPLPHSAQGHQRENAYSYAKATGALVIEEENATPHLVQHTLLRLFESPVRRKAMEEGAKAFARPESAELVAKEILALALSHP